MNRVVFMKQLESLLQNVSPTEREEALQYYNDYFDDAGKENEQEVIEALGNPAAIAENIRRDLYGAGNTSYQREADDSRAVIQYRPNTASAVPPVKEEDKGLSAGVIALIVVLVVLSSPIWIGLAGCLFGLLAGVIAALFGLIIGFGAAFLSLIAVMVVLVVVGLMCIVTSPLTGVALIGGGLVCGAIGLLFLMLTVAICGIVLPAICKGIVFLCRNLFGKKKKA